MTLRRRFTLAVAGAVAAVALAITAVAFIVVRADLQDQVKHELRQQAAVVERLARHYHGHIPAGWVPRDSGGFGASSAYAQVVTARGAVWAPAGDGGLLPGTAAAAQVAVGQRGSYYAAATLAGVHAMVLTTPVAPGLAVQLAVPLSAVDQELGRIGATLALLSAAGVGLAALAGWGVARAGLAPVGRLAAVAEQVAKTGDPGRRVEVDRADELRTPLTSLRINSELLAAEPGLPEAERQEILDRVVAQVAELGQLVAGVTELARGDEPARPGGDSLPSDPPGSPPADSILPDALGSPRGDSLPPDPPGSPRGDSLPLDPLGSPRGDPSVRTPLGRAEVNFAEVDFAEVDFAEVVAAALDGARRDWPRAVFTADLEPCLVCGHAERLKTAVRNLLDNAAKFGPPGGPVEVRLQAGELTVRDHGPGIPPGDLPRVFDRFYRAASARGVPGSGLGLSIVRQVAAGHGGTVRAEQAAGGGTLVRFRLPVLASGAMSTAAVARSAP
jgi:two-component system sensor histidine kinase MprB